MKMEKKNKAVTVITVILFGFVIFTLCGLFVPWSTIKIVDFKNAKSVAVELGDANHVTVTFSDNVNIEDFAIFMLEPDGTETRLTPMSVYTRECIAVFKVPQFTKKEKQYNLAVIYIPDRVDVINARLTIGVRRSLFGRQM